MITYIEDIVGLTYTGHEIEFIICCMILIWFMYQFIQLIYNILGFNK